MSGGGVLAASSDGGRTFSDPVPAGEGEGRVYQPRLAVDGDGVAHAVVPSGAFDPEQPVAPNGLVDLAWYDFRNSPEPETLPEEFGAPFNFGGFTDVYYSSSDNAGRTWEENIRVTDRIIDRRIGVWSNNIHSHYSVGIASTDDTVYFAWQDSRNGDEVTNAEDIYFASLHRDGDTTIVSAEQGGQGWAIGGAGLLLGMGLAMVLATVVVRRKASTTRPPAPA
jgi:hypothetical protein